MKKPVTVVGDRIPLFCSVCEIEQQHAVQTATKLGSVTRAACETCASVVTFSRGVKTAMSAGKGKEASPYDWAKDYKKGQSMMHATFGRGEVTAIVDSHKIDVLFGDKTRRMVHAVK